MTQGTSPARLFDACSGRLQLSWLNPADTAVRRLYSSHDQGYTLIGHFNLIHPHPIQVLDHPALSYLNGLKKNSLNDAIEQLCAPPTAIILLADGLEPLPELSEYASHQGLALIGSSLGSERLITEINYYLGSELAECQVMHGVFMEVMGIGVLLRGDSGIGKSELALELVNRGQRLIADDAPIFRRLGPDNLVGHCPPVLQDYLEVRGLGLLDIRAMFGDSAVKQEMPLQLIVELMQIDPANAPQSERLDGNRQTRDCLGLAIPLVSLPVAPGRNLAVLVEAAARNHILYTNGQDSVQAFIQRQRQIMRNDKS